MENNVIVLVSTYNGEKYIREQLDSILNQTYKNITILIRDDGSTDGTRSILNEYGDKYSNIKLDLDSNVGVIGSFNRLISNPMVDKYEYVCFCDQDDVWLSDKIESGLEFFSDKEIPQLYCSNLIIVDNKLNKIKNYYNNRPVFNRYTSIVQNCSSGCTQIFNKTAVSLYRKGIEKHIEMHDYWMFLVCLFLGEVYFDFIPHILYRQHSNNVVGAKNKKIVKAINNLKNKHHKREQMFNDFIDCYKLDEESVKIIKPLLLYKKQIKYKIKLLSLNYHGYNYKVTLGFKIRCLLNNIY